MQTATSPLLGLRLPGGRQKTVLEMKTSARVEPDGGEHPVEKLAAGADEGQAAAVLLAARRLADEDHPGGGAAFAENQVGRGLGQGAAVEAGEQGAELLQCRGIRGGGDGGRNRRAVRQPRAPEPRRDGSSTAGGGSASPSAPGDATGSGGGAA